MGGGFGQNMKLPTLKKPDFLNKLSQKRIPTLLGLGVLVIALVAGTLMIGAGPGVFAPRATPETTPQSVRVSNVTDSSFTVSFVTLEATAGFVRYGTSSNDLRSQAADDRDQLSGSVGSYRTHHVSVRGLEQNQTYYFLIGTGSGATFDNEGQPFSVTTTQRSGTPAAAKTIYGSVVGETGAPADGAIVYISHPDAGDMSSLVKSSGSWAVPLSNARTVEGDGYAQIGDDELITITVQGMTPTQRAQFELRVNQAQPVPNINLTATGATLDDDELEIGREEVIDEDEGEIEEEPEEVEELEEEVIEIEEELEEEEVEEEARIGRLDQLLTEEEEVSEEVTVIDLTQENEEEIVVTTSQPTIVGRAAPNTTVNITIRSENHIEQTLVTDEEGNFTLDLSQLESELEPGEHTVTYSYIDPDTSEEVSNTTTFWVADASLANTQNTQTANQTQPFGTEEPFPIIEEETDLEEEIATEPAEPVTRSAMPATDSAIPESGSVGTTFALIFGGLFFLTSGFWSFWVARAINRGEV